jgi:hypothetical protein
MLPEETLDGLHWAIIFPYTVNNKHMYHFNVFLIAVDSFLQPDLTCLDVVDVER